ncbi:hypothetical protein ACFLT9_08350 [Acidobacteriota bacterium]
MRNKAKAIAFIIPLILLSACIRQTVNIKTSVFDGYSYMEVWRASIRAVNDIDYTVYSTDRDSGFIGAESGPYVFQELPPRLSIMIHDDIGRVYVECKIVQMDQFIDVFGYGKKTVRRFMRSLNEHLRRAH